MRKTPTTVRALGLTSGGLDSMLAALVLRDQNIKVKWICFETPFFSADNAKKAARDIGISITVKNITPQYLKMLRDPPCGYGQNMNPCMDCHALMVNLAGQMMRQENFDFIFSGEVMGQRPMSQVQHALRYVEKRSGVDGYLLRPLSARALPETVPEKEGLVDRSRLYDITGRSRKRQLELAAHYGISDYPTPAGGCLLTDSGFSKRLKDLFAHQDECSEADLNALKFGRHFRLTPESKLIVGRNKEDNKNLAETNASGTMTVLKTETLPGPTCLLAGTSDESALMLAAGICAGYSKAPEDETVQVIATTGGQKRSITMLGIPPANVRHMLI